MEQLRNKFLLLDTNVLIESLKNIDDFGPFYSTLSDFEVKAVLDYTVKLEFLRGVRDREQQERFTAFINALFGKEFLELRVDNTTFDNAQKLSIIYGRKKCQAGLGDILIASQMLKFSRNNNLYLATINHDHFPRFVFDRVSIFTIDIKTKSDNIFNIGIYKFNKKAFDSLYAEFENS